MSISHANLSIFHANSRYSIKYIDISSSYFICLVVIPISVANVNVPHHLSMQRTFWLRSQKSSPFMRFCDFSFHPTFCLNMFRPTRFHLRAVHLLLFFSLLISGYFASVSLVSQGSVFVQFVSYFSVSVQFISYIFLVLQLYVSSH